MKHKLILMLLAVLLPAVASAYDFMVDGLAYNINSDGTSVTLTYQNDYSPRYDNLPSSVTIPENVYYNGKNYSVKAIIANCFYGSNANSISVPKTVTSIGASAFAKCANLSAFRLEDGDASITLTNSGTNQLFSDSPITSLYIGRNIVYSSSSYPTFKDNSTIESVRFGSPVTSIPSSLFNGCSSISSVSFNGNNLTTISSYAFQNCTNLNVFSTDLVPLLEATKPPCFPS